MSLTPIKVRLTPDRLHHLNLNAQVMGLGPEGVAVASQVAVRAAYRATRPEDFDFDSWEEC